MRLLLAGVVLALCGVPALHSAEEENPFKKAKVGDWAEYKMLTVAMGVKIDGKLKMTVTAKDDNKATLKPTASIKDTPEVAGQEIEIDLTKPYDPISTAGLPKGTEAKIEKDGDGDEKIKVNGKEYNAKWSKIKMSAKVMGQDFDADIKYWTSKDVPLSGMIKMEMKSKFADMTMELVGTGGKKAE